LKDEAMPILKSTLRAAILLCLIWVLLAQDPASGNMDRAAGDAAIKARAD
jgi:hypothetical protein